jgi:hypothetical protein
MGNLRGAMEKSFVFFALLLIGCTPLALMGMVSELAIFALVAAAACSIVIMMMLTPEESD